MAKKEDSDSGAKGATKPASAPAGFTTKVGRARGDGWVVKKPGAVVQGRLLGRYLMKAKSSNGDPRAYYQVKLSVPVEALYTPGEEDDDYEVGEDDRVKRIEVTLEPGQILNVDEITALKDLSPYTRDGGVYNVWFQYIKQDPKLRNFWRIEGPALEPVRAPKHAPTPEANGRSSQPVGDDEIPFG